MTGDGVPREVCDARRQSCAALLTEIRDDTATLKRVVVEGNGQEALTVQVAKNSDFREQMHEWLEAQRVANEAAGRAKRKRGLAVGIASVGWALSVIGLVVAIAT